MSDIFRHPMLHEPILFPRAVIAVIAGALSVFGLDVTIVDTADPGTVAESVGAAFQYLIPAALAAWFGHGYKSRAQTNSPATIAAYEAETAATVAQAGEVAAASVR